MMITGKGKNSNSCGSDYAQKKILFMLRDVAGDRKHHRAEKAADGGNDNECYCRNAADTHYVA